MNQRLLLPLVSVALIALGFGVHLILDDGPRADSEGLTSSGSASAEPGLAPSDGVAQRAPRGLTADEVARNDSVATTVVLPLKLEFELVAAASKLSAPGAKAMGSDATAKLRGSAHTAAGTGLSGQAEFVAGPNKGRVLELDEGGRFGANDLYPGLSMVHITGRNVPGAKREVLLREGRESQLNVGFGRPAVVFGQVFDRSNNSIIGALVEMDGQESVTDDRGVFSFLRMASGKVPVFVSKPGYGDLRSVLNVSAGTKTEIGRIKFTLEEAATLSITLADRVGTGAPAQVTLSRPLEARYGGMERKYPWHLKNPTMLYAGETVEIEGLPPGRVRIQVFQPGAIVEPATRETTLIAGQRREEVFNMKAAPVLSGRVFFDGKLAKGALVQLEAPDMTGASIGARKGTLGRATVELDLFEHAPSARQKVLTGADGRFEFSAGEELSAVRYLHARSADGKAWAGVAVKKGEREVDLELTAAPEQTATLSIETSTRFQGLPVVYLVDGKPHQEMLEAGERLVIEGLPEGSWRYTAKWGNETIQNSTPIEVKGEVDLFVPLPEGAIQGQSKEMRDSMSSRQTRNGRRG